nr:276_t:CDS:10 [Entrophospora candida]
MQDDNTTCQYLCPKTISGADAKFINERIRENYAINWLIDGLPAASKKIDLKTSTSFYSIGFELGDPSTTPTPSFNNHYEIHIQYHEQDNSGKYRVVEARTCQVDDQSVLALDEQKDNSVHFTYRVTWDLSETAWATRWDNYLHTFDPRIHWFSLVNSVVIVLFLTGMVAMILLRALHKDISRYNQLEAQEDVQEDFGWKLVHGDVFRPPSNMMLLSVLLGSGAQLYFMTAVTLVFAVLGFLSPSNRGSLATVMLIFYMLFGFVAGFVSARIYKMFGGESWKKNVFFTAFLFPGVIFSILLLLNFFLVYAKSSGAVPATTLLAIIGLWFIISVPLCFTGSFIGFRKPRIEHPVRTNQIPRQIPDQVFYLRPIPSMLMGGVLPFGAIFIELYFIMNSIWGSKVYYLFGFAALVFIILTITCSEVTILLCYFHLCAEDYHWSWRAFFTSGASGFYIFLYSIMYYATRLQISSLTNTVIYFGWTGAISLMFLVLTDNDISSLIIDIREYQESLIDEIINGLNKPENVIKNIPTFLLNEADCIVGHINIKDNGLVIGLGSGSLLEDSTKDGMDFIKKGEEKEIIINLKEDELIHVEYSYKYDKKKFWINFFIDHDGDDGSSRESISTLDEWKELWKSWDTITMSHVPAFLGHNDDEYKDDDEQYDSSKEFGWDNESPRKEVIMLSQRQAYKHAEWKGMRSPAAEELSALYALHKSSPPINIKRRI